MTILWYALSFTVGLSGGALAGSYLEERREYVVSPWRPCGGAEEPKHNAITEAWYSRPRRAYIRSPRGDIQKWKKTDHFVLAPHPDVLGYSADRRWRYLKSSPEVE